MSKANAEQPNEAQLAVHWKEEQYYYPPVSFVAQANMTDGDILERFGEKNFPECFKEYADLLSWYKYWEQTLDTSNPPFWKWFVGGVLNASYNCVDRHLAQNRNKTAIHFVPEPVNEGIQHITYQELWVRVNELAALLRDFCGLKRGDRVTLHMPMIAELPITMLACARLGVIHSQVFSGFSGQACGERIADSGSRVLITADSYWRGGNLLDHKKLADVAFDKAKEEKVVPEKVLVWQRYPGKNSAQTPLVEGRDFVVNELLPKYRGQRVEPERMLADRSAVPDVHQRQHRAAEGLPAQHRGLPVLRRGHLQDHPGHPSDRRVLVHGGHRLDHRPLVHRLRPAGAGRLDGDLRGRAQLSPTPDGRGASPRSWGSTSSTPRPPRSAPCAARARTSPRSTTTISST